MNDISKSWFCVFNNPDKHGYVGEPHEVVEKLKNEWIEGHPSRTGAWVYCVSADGLPHIHMVLEDVKAMRFSAIKKSYAIGMHFEPTKGTKEQAESYINKKGKFEEKGEQIIFSDRYGEIKGVQGARRDIEVIEEMINNGLTPKQILNMSLSYRRYEKMIRDAYFDKRNIDLPFMRDVIVYWHVGKSGTGKSYSAKQLIDTHGEESLYFVSDYESGGFDHYSGEKILFLDEFRGQIKYSVLLHLLDVYKCQIHSRYTNTYALWSEVHISSVLPPERVYERMVDSDRNLDTVKQLFRRLNYVVYHWKEEDSFLSASLPMEKYKDYDNMLYKLNHGDEFHYSKEGEEIFKS